MQKQIHFPLMFFHTWMPPSLRTCATGREEGEARRLAVRAARVADGLRHEVEESVRRADTAAGGIAALHCQAELPGGRRPSSRTSTTRRLEPPMWMAQTEPAAQQQRRKVALCARRPAPPPPPAASGSRWPQ